MDVVYLADKDLGGFDEARSTVDVVCAGDSITGWNNFGPANLWPYPTYPRFLQPLTEPSGLRIADGGIAGEVSDNGLGHVQRYLDLFLIHWPLPNQYDGDYVSTWEALEAFQREGRARSIGVSSAAGAGSSFVGRAPPAPDQRRHRVPGRSLDRRADRDLRAAPAVPRRLRHGGRRRRADRRARGAAGLRPRASRRADHRDPAAALET